MTELVSYEVLDQVAATLALRQPNYEAVESVVAEIANHFDVRGLSAPFEGIVDSATGVGKTYVMAATIDYLAQVRGVRDFAIIAPSRVILDKTVEQFSATGGRSLVADMGVPVSLITADNFVNATTVALMEDETRVKVYVFTVQALLRPKSQTERKTHGFRETLGGGFYERLQAVEDLVVLADEHHAYTGPEFSNAVRDLHPMALIGLTATPHKSTTDDDVIFRYPLAAAIAEEFVKTPVIVGRRDDKKDPATKLADGLTLLALKRKVAEKHSATTGKPRINPVMLVVAKDTTEADEWASIVRSGEFMGGEYQDAVLVVHSKAAKDDLADEQLRSLKDVENPDSPIRVVVSVAMLKEGWDVKNVFVLLSTQPSLSEILTEQVLGRGLRLPWGEYQHVQLLDTLEVIAHDRYEDLLKKKGVLSEDFVDYRIRAAVRQDAEGRDVLVRERTEVTTPIAETGVGTGTSAELAAGATTTSTAEGEGVAVAGQPTMSDVESRTVAAQAETAKFSETLAAIRTLSVPLVRATEIVSTFSLTDITDVAQFRRIGERLGVDPTGTLRRTLVRAKVVTAADGTKSTQLVTENATDVVEASGLTMTLEDLRSLLTSALLGAPMVDPRQENTERERRATEPILEAFFEGLNGGADSLLSAYLERSTALLLGVLAEESRRFAAKPTFSEKVQMRQLGGERTNTRAPSSNRLGPFSRSTAYEGWQRSAYSLEWFDSEPERAMANLLDDEASVEIWMRLHTGELPIVWSSEGRRYNADFIVVETNDERWIVEVKADKEMTTAEVQAKRQAAQRWVNVVNASGVAGAKWHYLLVSQSDIKAATGSWAALKGLGT